MATHTDVALSNTAWTNVHTTLSLSAGTAITVQNKTIFPVVLNVSVVMPSDNSSGIVVGANDYTMYSVAPGGSEYLWARSFGNSGTVLGVQ